MLRGARALIVGGCASVWKPWKVSNHMADHAEHITQPTGGWHLTRFRIWTGLLFKMGTLTIYSVVILLMKSTEKFQIESILGTISDQILSWRLIMANLGMKTIGKEFFKLVKLDLPLLPRLLAGKRDTADKVKCGNFKFLVSLRQSI